LFLKLAGLPQKPAASFFQGKTEFQRHLPFADFALLDGSAGLGHLKPSHVADCLFGARQRILYRLLKAVRRRTNYFNLFVNVIRHALIISCLMMKDNKKPSRS